MEKWKKRAAELAATLAIGDKAFPAVIPYRPQKTSVSAPELPFFKRSTPSKHGVSPRKIRTMLHELEAEKRANIHCLMILKDGEVIAESAAPGYDVNIRKVSYSMSKTIVAMAIGCLVDDGALDVDTPLVEIFPEIPYRDKRFPHMTVDHLLSMSSGVDFNEAGTVTEEKWTNAFFAAPLAFEPGSAFSYNSMNSYILARIVERISGVGVADFLRSRLFAPLGITNVLWEKSPEGCEKGGFGLSLSAESFLKLGYMMLSGGMFCGRRILSEKWVSASVRTHKKSPESAGDFNYGYHLWVGREENEFLFNGMLGQNVWVLPRRKIVAVILSGNNELFQQSPALDIVRRRLKEDTSLGFSRSEEHGLRTDERDFFKNRMPVPPLREKRRFFPFLPFGDRRPFDERITPFLGTYQFPDNNQGVLPLFVRAVQNNYSGGIHALSLRRYGNGLMLTTEEGDGKRVFRVGLYGYESQVVDFAGEKYLVRTLGGIREEGIRRHLVLCMLFPELPNTRLFDLSFTQDGNLRFSMTEIPDQKIAESYVDTLPAAMPKFALLSEILKRRLGDNFIQKKLFDIFHPVLIGVDTMRPDFAKALAKEEEKVRAERARYALLSSLISRFTDTADAPEPPPSSGGFFFSRLPFLRQKSAQTQSTKPQISPREKTPKG